ncbi:glycosyltransferase [Halomonas sp. PGE1]|uniref:glycosyltransferase family 4 protein n=1 Tax=Halomonas sp. PGE1 TaxID=2730360 RepID=UPI001473E1F4|nr:glycosyltransferase [Halomonas sp. PGE1]QJQ99310.1 glycosyltransferase [Halomonas sp. PGE1]
MSKTAVGNTAVLCFSPGDGGMEYDAAYMASKIEDQLGTCLLVVRKGSWLERYALDNQIPCEAISFRNNFSMAAIKVLKSLWKAHDVRNVIFLGSSEIRTIHFSINAPVQRFIVRHGTTKSSSKKDLVRRLTWSRVTAHWCISQHLKRNVQALFPVGRAEVFVDYVGLGDKLAYLPEGRCLERADEELRLVHVGRLVAGKGQHDALQVLKLLHERGVPATLSFFGRGEEQSSLEAQVAELGLGKAVTFVGHVERPYRCFGDFHGFLYPSHGEGFGNAFIEALASGMHCFSYDNTVFPELRGLGLKFHIVAHRDVRALADEVCRVWEAREPRPLSNIMMCRELFSTEKEMEILRRYLA